MIHRLSTACGFFVCVGMRATFCIYDHVFKIPEARAKFSIYDELFKIPEKVY
jgi:hypothetical protein